jgi:membrane fusion protein (multidrug efflux system)
MKKEIKPFRHRLTLIAILIFLNVIVACNNKEMDKEESKQVRIAEVGTITLKPQTYSETIHSFGVIEAAKEIIIALDFSEHVKNIYFNEGDRVTAGQLIIELDEQKQRLKIAQFETSLKKAKAIMENAQTSQNRYQKLFKNGHTSLAKLETVQLEFQTAKAQYEDALNALRLSKRELADRRILSPVNGIIDKRSIDPGEMAMPGQPLVVIQAVDAVRVLTYVTEKEINRLQLGSETSISTAGALGRRYVGRIESIGAKADPSTGNFSIKIAISNSDGLLRPGMTAQVIMEDLKDQEAILIPDTTLVDRDRRRVAYKVVDGKAVEVAPIVSLSYGEKVHVLSGLQAGDQLIVEGMEFVKHGSPVKVIPSS